MKLPLFKKDNGKAKMMSLLNEIQAFLRIGGDGETLSIYQQALIPKTKTFIQYASEYKSQGLSEYGGLLKYCINAITIVNNGLAIGETPIPIVVHIAEKMAHVALAMKRITSEEEMTIEDKVLLVEAQVLANGWLVNPKREVLVNKIETIVADLHNRLSKQGKLETLKKGEANFEPLMVW
jgi:hypothetical protein